MFQTSGNGQRRCDEKSKRRSRTQSFGSGNYEPKEEQEGKKGEEKKYVKILFYNHSNFQQNKRKQGKTILLSFQTFNAKC